MRLRTILILAGVLVAVAIGYYFTALPPEPAPKAEPRVFVWSVEMTELASMAISLPQQSKKEAWVKHEDKQWYFDRPNGPRVDNKRWGGGIPLILSGPGAERIIMEDATDEQLEIYGLMSPLMIIELTTDGGKMINAEVGDRTPDGQAHYLKLKDSRDVYTVHTSWFEVLERLVLEPPYLPEST
jgi:hypothetical protein